MKVVLYILGLLIRYGDMHGYKLKQIIDREVADFANIKLPNLYYHLNKMIKQALIVGHTEQEGPHPEKKVYHLTEKGHQVFLKYLEKAYVDMPEFEFLFDSVMYFREHICEERLRQVLEQKIDTLFSILSKMDLHEKETNKYLSEVDISYSKFIFKHHKYHYEAELRWYQELLEKYKEKI